MIRMLSGNEAMARGAWEAGVRVASAYPGTPSTEILENSRASPTSMPSGPQRKSGHGCGHRRRLCRHARHGRDEARGPQRGRRCVLLRRDHRHEAGLVIVIADDPAMHSSQDEQDNRRYAKFARVPCLEPSDSQEAKDLVGAALEISEQFDTPVHAAHSPRASPTRTASWSWRRDGRRKPRGATSRFLPHQTRFPATRQVRDGARQRARATRSWRSASPAWPSSPRPLPVQPHRAGRSAAGHRHQRRGLPVCPRDIPARLVPAAGHDLPCREKLIREFAAQVKRLIVIEELDPFIEEEIRLMGIPVRGQEHLPAHRRARPGVGARERHPGRAAAESAHVALSGVAGGPAARRDRRCSARAARIAGCSSRAQQAQAGGQRRHRLLHPGPIAAPERAAHLRLHGRQHRRGPRRDQGRQPRKKTSP